MELLKIDNEMDDLIAHRASVHQLKQAALARGFRPLAADGIRRVLEGVTSLAEIARVVDLTERLA
jgi:type II secretory ATPase GspE/PulE/Tfp pilus assembly ATPase PilB-like protein